MLLNEPKGERLLHHPGLMMKDEREPLQFCTMKCDSNLTTAVKLCKHAAGEIFLKFCKCSYSLAYSLYLYKLSQHRILLKNRGTENSKENSSLAPNLII